MSWRAFISCLFVLGTLAFLLSPISDEGRAASLRQTIGRMVDTITYELRDVWRLCTAKPAPKPRLIPLRPKIAKVKWRRAQPNLKADYYIYLHSHSWCKTCGDMMSYFASRHKEMKKDGRVELLMISYDDYQEHEEALLNAHNAEFPVAHYTDPAVADLPGITLHCGRPIVNVMRASGQKLKDGHGLVVVFWREHTLDFGKKKQKKRRKWW